MTDWIDVEEKLPPNGVMVLALAEVYTPVDYLQISRGKWIFQAEFTKSSGWHVFFFPDNVKRARVTHWMPLPKAPEEI